MGTFAEAMRQLSLRPSRASRLLCVRRVILSEVGDDQTEQQHGQHVFREFLGGEMGPFRPRGKRHDNIVHDQEDDDAVGEPAHNPEAPQDRQPAGRDDVRVPR